MILQEVHIQMLQWVRENPEELIVAGSITPVEMADPDGPAHFKWEIITRRMSTWTFGERRSGTESIRDANLDALADLWTERAYNRWDEDDSGAWELEHPTPPDHIIAA